MDKFFKAWDIYGEEELLLNIDRVDRMEIQATQGEEHSHELVAFVGEKAFILKKFQSESLVDEFMSRRQTV